MSQTLTISDVLYARLEQITHARGLTSIEQLLEEWQTFEAERQQRIQVVQRIDQVREQLFAIYGEMPNSVALLREDRWRCNQSPLPNE
jgi:hypothetical protein